VRILRGIIAWVHSRRARPTIRLLREDLADGWESLGPLRSLASADHDALHPVSELPHPIITKAAESFGIHAADDNFVGRRTFEDLRSYWPKQTDGTTGVADYLNQVQKYVVSSTMTDPEWEPTFILSGDPVDEVQALKEQPGKDIVVTGSITLCHTLIEAGLVDEYRFFVYPVVQGRLFPVGYEMH
jgi:dihydrofolate reductase